MESLSLRERLLQKSSTVNEIKEEKNVMSVEGHDDGSDESDIDDNITLEECEMYIDKRKERSFTKVKVKTPDKLDSHNLITHDNNDDNDENLDRSYTQTLSDLVPVLSNPDSDSEPSQAMSEDIITSEVDDLSLPTKGKTRRKVTAEERKAIKEQKEKEKLEKQKIKDQKEKEKLEKQKKREEIKLQKQMEKEHAKALKERDRMAARAENKNECMDRILAVVDPCLVQEVGGGDILKDLQDLGVRYELKALPIVCCIGWLRENVDYSVGDDRKVQKSVTYTEEDQVIHKISSYELATRIQAQNDLEDEEETFIGLVKSLKKTFSGKKITVLVIGLNAYHRLMKTKKNEEFRKRALGDELGPAIKRKKKDMVVPTITKNEIDKHLIRLQLTTNISIRFCEDMADMSKLVTSFTKALADAPFKKTPVSSLEFNTLANKESYKISSDGHGVAQVWNQQLQQFYGVRNDTSTAITQLYPTPWSLMKAYKDLTTSEGERLLQDLQVRRGVGVLQTQRRVGPELSRKIHKLFTSLDGNEPLGK